MVKTTIIDQVAREAEVCDKCSQEFSDENPMLTLSLGAVNNKEPLLTAQLHEKCLGRVRERLYNQMVLGVHPHI